MEPVFIILAVLVLAAVAYFVLGRGRQLPPPKDEPRLPEGKAPTAEAKAPESAPKAPEATPKAPEGVPKTPTQDAAKASAGEAAKASAEAGAKAPEAAPKTPEPAPAATPSVPPASDSLPGSGTVVVAVVPPVVSAPEARRETVPGPRPAEVAAPAGDRGPYREPEPERPRRDLSALLKGLAQTRTGWVQKLLSVFTTREELQLDPSLLETVEETLLTGDVGVAVTRRMVDTLKERVEKRELGSTDRVWEALKADALKVLNLPSKGFGASPEGPGKPLVILVVGVNGAGKTTTIAKLASRYKDQGRKVLLAAGDTFRAAAVTQLEMWGRRVGVPVYKGKDGAKPSAVIFEAIGQATSQGVDVVLADTAGRLQTKQPLMEELRKIRDACGKAQPGAPHEVLLVLDATTGQNAISQAREFRETLDLTGVVLTKLDGTAKGGVILAVAEEFKLPVRFIGVGERSDDLREFDARDFVDALFARGDGEAAA